MYRLICFDHCHETAETPAISSMFKQKVADLDPKATFLLGNTGGSIP